MKVEKIKKTGSKYKLTLENGEIINTYDEVIIKHKILYKKEIDESLLDKINEDTIYFKNYNKILNLINVRLRSEYEVRKTLIKNEVSSNDIEKMINDLKNINLINDELFAKAYTNDKINLSLDGPYKIKKNLQKHKINNEYIDNAIENIDKDILDAHIDKVISKKIKNNSKYTPYMLRQKIITYLVNLGYSKNSIINRLDNFKIEYQNYENQIDKIYNKLKNKYEGDMLILKLKNKLYSKGYSKEDIENYIDKKTVH